MAGLDYQTMLNIQKQTGAVPGSILQAIQGPRQDQLQMGANRLNATVAAQGQQQAQQMQALQMMAGMGIQSKQADMQRAEAERQREYQSAEAEKQRQFQKEMFLLANARKRGGRGGNAGGSVAAEIYKATGGNPNQMTAMAKEYLNQSQFSNNPRAIAAANEANAIINKHLSSGYALQQSAPGVDPQWVKKPDPYAQQAGPRPGTIGPLVNRVLGPAPAGNAAFRNRFFGQ